MSQYIDGFVLLVRKSKLAAYRKMAAKASKVWLDHGALEYRECVGDDMDAPGMVAFPKLAKAKPNEVVIFAYVVFKSRRHRDAANKKIFADPRLAAMCDPNDLPFDFTRMARGGFTTIVGRNA